MKVLRVISLLSRVTVSDVTQCCKYDYNYNYTYRKCGRIVGVFSWVGGGAGQPLLTSTVGRANESHSSHLRVQSLESTKESSVGPSQYPIICMCRVYD